MDKNDSQGCHIDLDKLRLDQLYYAVLHSVNLALVADHVSPEIRAANIVSLEAAVQECVNKFRTKQYGFDTVYYSVADGLRKRRLLITQATQIITTDLVDLHELGNCAQEMCSDLQAIDGEFNQMYEIIPVELDRQLAEEFGLLHTEALGNLDRAQEISEKKLARLAYYFERQYLDAVASLMRWWKHYDEMLMMNFERDATTASNEMQIMVRTYRKQLADRTATIDFLLRESKYISDQIKDFDDKKQKEERTAKGILKRKGRELDKLTHGVDKFLLTTQLLRTEEATLRDSLQNKTMALQTLNLQLKNVTADYQNQEAAQRDKINRMRDRLALEKRALEEINEQCEKFRRMIEHPEPVHESEIIKRNAMQQKIDQAKREQVTYGQQLQIVQQELRGIDRIYERRFQTLQKIGFKLRNETYVRRLLERKFYKLAKFLNLNHLAAKGKLDAQGHPEEQHNDPEFSGFGDLNDDFDSKDLLNESSSEPFVALAPAAPAAPVKVTRVEGTMQFKKAKDRDEEPDG